MDQQTEIKNAMLQSISLLGAHGEREWDLPIDWLGDDSHSVGTSHSDIEKSDIDGGGSPGYNSDDDVSLDDDLSADDDEGTGEVTLPGVPDRAVGTPARTVGTKVTGWLVYRRWLVISPFSWLMSVLF
jgi:hypothetical protein